MSVAITSDMISASYSAVKADARTKELSNKLNTGKDATDEELMDACKTFETYMIEQVLKSAEKTVMKSDDEEGDYLSMFKDNMYQEYAKLISDSGELGLAQQLYESMKRY